MQPNSGSEHVEDESRGPYFPFNRRETYPPRLKVDFRRLPTSTLLQYTGHHDLHIRPDSSHEELAIAAARHFAGWSINEEAIMRSFCAGLASSSLGSRRGLGDDEIAEADRKRKRVESLDYLDVVPPSPERWGGSGGGGGGGYRDSGGRSYASSSSVSSTPPRSKDRNGRVGGGGGERGRGRNPSYPRRTPHGNWDDGPEFATDEQVAAHVVRKMEEPDLPPRAWILARVVRQKGGGMVELHDEDDPSHEFELHETDVLHLEDFSSDLRKHDSVLAVFPDTTIFYSATVARDTPTMVGNSKMVVVKFEDDMDSEGNSQHRRVPVEHVLPEEHHRYGGPGGHRGVGGGSRSGRGKSGTSPRATGGSRSRSTSPRVRGEYAGGGGAAGNYLHGGAASLASRVSGGTSASGGGGGRASSANKDQQGSKKGGATYADMIAHALTKVEDGKGGFMQICDIIEKEFSEHLNWKLESDVRKTPVWKSSVRKICFSNTRFQHVTTDPQLGHVFTMARKR